MPREKLKLKQGCLKRLPSYNFGAILKLVLLASLDQEKTQILKEAIEAQLLKRMTLIH